MRTLINALARYRFLTPLRCGSDHVQNRQREKVEE
jgi:hypothetical protein